MEDLKYLGERFRKKREEKKLSLKEVENVLSIRKVYLQAIEEGRAVQFLSPTYALGFIKQYARFLGYDPEELVRENPKAFRFQTEKQEFSYGIGTLERGATTGGALLLWVVIILFTMLIFLYVGCALFAAG